MITESYLGLEQHIRGCQNQEPLFNCTTRNYIESVIKNCGCLPLIIKLMSHMKVKLFYPMWSCDAKWTLTQLYFLQEPTCTSSNFQCVQDTKGDTSKCLPPCSGLILSSYTKTDKHKDLNSLIPSVLKDYSKYQKCYEKNSKCSFPLSLKGL